MELHVRVIGKEDVDRLVLGALELLPSQDGAMLPRKSLEALPVADDEPEVLEPHPVDTLVKRRDQLDKVELMRAEWNGLPEEQLRDRATVPDVFAVCDRMLLEAIAQLEIVTPCACAIGNVADR